MTPGQKWHKYPHKQYLYLINFIINQVPEAVMCIVCCWLWECWFVARLPFCTLVVLLADIFLAPVLLVTLLPGSTVGSRSIAWLQNDISSGKKYNTHNDTFIQALHSNRGMNLRGLNLTSLSIFIFYFIYSSLLNGT